MFLRKLFERNKKTDVVEPKEEKLGETDNAPSATKVTEEPPVQTDTDVVQPLNNTRTTSIPLPVPPDATAFTDPQKEKKVQESDETKKVDETKDDIKDDAEDDKTTDLITRETCDVQTCRKERLVPQTCVTSSKASSQHDAENKISPTKLTAMINTSIKEAMETIVKQCKMQDEEKEIDKKPSEEYVKSVCCSGKKIAPIQVKRECHPCPNLEANSRLRTSRSVRLPKKCKNYRVHSKKLHEKVAKPCSKKGSVCEQRKKKKCSKSVCNGKTDNRRMTGNVNIYICSEATENAQAVTKPKKPDPCTESCSETTTEQSGISESKLVTCIRNKRRKCNEQDSSDYLSNGEEGSDESTTCSSKCTEKLQGSSVIDVCGSFNEIICIKETSSILTDCKCTDINDDNASERPKFIICDKIETPCSTIYTTRSLSNSGSEGWSSNSSRRTDTVPCDNWSLEPNLNDYNSEGDSQKTFKRNLGGSCKCSKKDREISGKHNARCNCRSKRYSKAMEKGNSVPPWSACNCITEEEEEDVCVDGKSENSDKTVEERKEKVTLCPTFSDLKEWTKYTTDVNGSPRKSGANIPEDTESLDLNGQEKITKGERGRKLRPEAIILKNALQQQRSPRQATDQNSGATIPVKELDEDPSPNGSNSRIRAQVLPDILKKFNLRDQYKYRRQSVTVEKEAVQQEKEEEQAPANKEIEKGKETTGFQEWLKGTTSRFKRLSKILGRSKDSEAKPEEFTEKDNVPEPPMTDTTADKNVEMPRTEDENQLLEPSKIEMNESNQGNNNSIRSKTNPNNLMENKANKSDSNAGRSSNQLNDKENQEVNIKNNRDNSGNSRNSGNPSNYGNYGNSGNLVNSGNSSEHVKLHEKKNTPDTELTSKVRSERFSNISESGDAMRKHEGRKSSKGLRDSQERNEHEFQQCRTQCENQDRKLQLDVDSDKESITVCAKFSSEPQETDLRTICINSVYPKYPNMNEHFPNKESLCNCCCIPISQCDNKPANYPKGCLKKEKQCCHVDPQENNCAISYLKKCACRRLPLCNSCCRPRNECSCRLPIPCANCYKPTNKCNCKSVCEQNNSFGCIKSMFCLYCDNPRDKCKCRAPVQKCACCELSVDLCVCKDQKTICDGRPVLTEPDNDHIMYVTAWKPREEVRRYFSRNLTDPQTDSMNECCCCENPKSHNSDDLPYQRLSVFSDVMDELQHKISGSTCCTRCRKIPCCCSIKSERDEGREERKIKHCVSPKTRRKIIAVCVDKSKNKGSNNCKCDSAQVKSDKPNKIIIPVYCACKTVPCKCRKSRSHQKKPRAKCYYCKTSPCVCITSRERNKPRPCRCTDSPCRTKEKESKQCGKTSTKPKNNDEKTICVR